MKARLALLGLSGFLLVACSQEAHVEAPPRPVLTMVVEENGAASRIRFAGEIRSRTEQVLAFRIAGKISERLVDAGATVKAGQVLARLDPVDAGLTVEAAEAQRALAEADAARFRELRARNFVSQSALDSRETQLKAAQSQADLARNQSAYTALKADQAGIVGQVLGEVGQVVAPGQAVFRIIRHDALEVAIAIPESRLAEVRRIGVAEVSLWSNEGQKYRGRLREIAGVPDAQTRTYAARVTLDDADPQVVFGMSATVTFNTGSSQDTAIVIPQTALLQKEGKPAVWLVDGEGKVSRRAVEVERYSDQDVVLRGGLTPGERIVLAGIHKLRDGQLIQTVDQTPITKTASEKLAGSTQ